jgi:hypothetical protein
MIIIAQAIERFQRHIAARHRPLIVLFQEQRANEADDGVLVGEDGDHVGASLDLAVEALERIGGVQQLETIERLLERAKAEQDWPTIAPLKATAERRA